MRRGRLGPSGLALAALLTWVDPGAAETVYLVSHGWHVGLALRRDDLLALSPPSRLPAPPVEYVEIGWGDGDFYPAPWPPLSLGLRAARCSRSGVMQAAGFAGPCSVMFPGQKVLALEVTPAGFAALARHIEASLAVKGHRQPPARSSALR